MHIIAPRFQSILGFLLLLLCSPSLLQGQQVAAELDITPDTYYQLRFEVTGLQKPAQSIIKMIDAQGLVHHDGVITGDDHRLTPDQTTYTHAFLSASHAVKLRLQIDHSSAQVRNVSLERIEPAAMVLNGDLSLPGFAGLPVRANVQRVTHEGKEAWRINTNGYALSEYIPVQGGTGLRYTRGSHSWPGVTLLAYDRNKRFLTKLSNNFRLSPPISVPKDAAYLRLLFHTSHDHIPTHATVHFTGAGLEKVDAPAAPDDGGSTTPSQPTSQAVSFDKAFGEIILAPGSDGREELAARELQHWIAAITGVTLPVLAEPSSFDRLRLKVGHKLAAAFTDDLASLRNTDGYAIRRKNKDVHVFGASSRGTLFGVYALLEKNTDIIWPRPADAMEAVYSRRKTIDFTRTDVISIPAFRFRQISNTYKGNDGYVIQRWFARNGLNTPQHVHMGFDYVAWMYGSDVGYGGSFISWAHPDETTQDLYPLVDGKRDISRWRQPCYTHPKLPGRIAAKVRERYQTLAAAGIEADYLHITLADNWTVCACDRCMTPIKLADGSTLAPKSAYATGDALFFSTRTFIMLNQVAELLSKDFPDLKIQTHAYIFTAEPPAVKIHPNIIPQYAAYPTQNVRYPIMAGKSHVVSFYDKEIWKRRFIAWDKLDLPLGYFGYYYVPGFSALADTAAQDYRDLLEAGGVQVHTEGYPEDTADLNGWDMDAIEKWTMARLMWDPKQDPAALREHYIQRVYGQSASAMTQFHKLINDAWHAPSDSVFFNCHVSPQILFDELIIKQDLEEPLQALLVKAQQTASEPIARQMVDRKLAQLKDLRDRFGQHGIPHVEEATAQWNQTSSPHWEKAVMFKDFLLVDDWRQRDRQPASQQTQVRLMHDGEHLYVKFSAMDDDLSSLVMPANPGPGVFPQGDRVELMLRLEGKRVYYIAAGPGGSLYTMPNIQGQAVSARPAAGDGWDVMIALPLKELQWSAEQPLIELQAGRVYRHEPSQRDESTLSGVSLYNKSDVFWTKTTLDLP